MKCFVCEEEYDNKNRQTAFFVDDNKKIQKMADSTNRIYRLCPRCMRMAALIFNKTDNLRLDIFGMFE